MHWLSTLNPLSANYGYLQFLHNRSWVMNIILFYESQEGLEQIPMLGQILLGI